MAYQSGSFVPYQSELHVQPGCAIIVMTEETGILFNRAYTIVFEFQNITILLKIENAVYK